MNAALKEWASITGALADGRQIALLRKGGIVEANRGGFQMRHREFWLFPTYEHEHARYLRIPPPAPLEESTIPVSVMAQVTDVIPAPADASRLLTLGDEFVWNEAYVRLRYEYRPDLPLWLILVRASRFTEPVTIPNRGSYAGCKSWVNLTEDIIPVDMVQSLEDEAFEARRNSLLAGL